MGFGGRVGGGCHDGIGGSDVTTGSGTVGPIVGDAVDNSNELVGEGEVVIWEREDCFLFRIFAIL